MGEFGRYLFLIVFLLCLVSFIGEPSLVMDAVIHRLVGGCR